MIVAKKMKTYQCINNFHTHKKKKGKEIIKHNDFIAFLHW